ncbi:hypothetical protein [Streptomyces alkaliphilus]|nr:hypothetical protein [Streptomyces alkaliphilus]
MVEHLLTLARSRDLDHLCFGPVDPGAEELRRASFVPDRRGGAGQ